MKRAIFVTGTDTGVGKTTVSGLLGRFLLARGCRVITQKWIETGARKFSTDVDTHLELMNKKRKDFGCNHVFSAPYIFRFASSPHLAARLEKKTINISKIKQSFRFLSRNFDVVIVEGIGGVLVPLSRRRLVVDVAEELKLPALIVVGNKLGAINHALLTIEAIKRRNMKIIGLIFNNQRDKGNKAILRDNPKIIRALTTEAILGTLPYLEDKHSLYKRFIPIGEKVSRAMEKNE